MLRRLVVDVFSTGPILSYISNGFARFFYQRYSTSFWQSYKIATDLSQHDALNGAHVHETTLRVTYGGLRLETHFLL